jgi:hypothetical protein
MKKLSILFWKYHSNQFLVTAVGGSVFFHSVISNILLNFLFSFRFCHFIIGFIIKEMKIMNALNII